MGATTNGFVLTKEKDVFKVWQRVKYALVEDMMEVSGAERQIDLWWKEDSGFTYPTSSISEFGMLQVFFEYKNENRELSIHFHCDQDYNEYKKGSKIITSLGAWGESVHLTEVVLRSLKEFGTIHIIDNDCETEWRKLK